MSYKYLVNNSGKDLTVALIVRSGSTPGTTLDTVRVKVPAGQTVRAEYGNDANPFLDGVNVGWDASGSAANQKQVVTSRGSAWDDVMNTHDTLTFGTLTVPAISGSNR